MEVDIQADNKNEEDSTLCGCCSDNFKLNATAIEEKATVHLNSLHQDKKDHCNLSGDLFAGRVGLFL